jgi:hypothetical protein
MKEFSVFSFQCSAGTELPCSLETSSRLYDDDPIGAHSVAGKGAQFSNADRVFCAQKGIAFFLAEN